MELFPVWLGKRYDRRDVQADFPLGWCVRCKMEIWSEGQELCEKCREGLRQNEQL